MIYLAAPWFTEKEAKIYQVVKDYLVKKLGLDVYVPQDLKIKNAWNMPEYKWAKKVFDADIKALKKADEVIVLNFGLYSDSGTAFEAGMAYALGISVTNVLCAESGTNYSLMIVNGSKLNVPLVNFFQDDYESIENKQTNILSHIHQK